MFIQTVILVATKTEEQLVQRYLREHQNLDNTRYYRIGVGKTNTFVSLHRLMESLRLEGQGVQFVNIGLCGSNNIGHKVYDLIEPVNFEDGDRDNTNEFTKYDLYPEMTGQIGPTLVSCSRFSTFDKPDGKLYDMEGFAIAAFCKEFCIDWKCFKIVSDCCNKESEATYQALDCEYLYKKFKEALDGCEWIR